MSDHEQHETERLEAALKGLTPLPAALDRDRLMFRAGQATRRAGWRIGVVTALVGVLAGAVGSYAGLRAVWQPETKVQIVYVSVPMAAPAKTEVAQLGEMPPTPAPPTEVVQSPLWDWSDGIFGSNGGYLNLRNQVLRWGVDALPTAIPASADKHQPEPTNLLKLQAELREQTSGL